MPILARITGPEFYAKTTAEQLPRFLPESVRLMIERQPLIGMTGEKRNLINKYVVPNKQITGNFPNGFWCYARPAYGTARDLPQGHVRVLALLVYFPVKQLPDEHSPVLRLTGSDVYAWGAEMATYASVLADKGFLPR